RAAHVRGGRGDFVQPEPSGWREHGPARADFQQRDFCVRSGAGSSVGRGVHARGANVFAHARGTPRHGAIRGQEVNMTEGTEITSTEPSGPLRRQIAFVPGAGEAPTGEGGPVVLKLDAIEVFYGKFRAVHGVTLDIHDKQITAFIGPSGCGKTTV